MEFATMMELLLSGLAFTLQIFVTTLIGLWRQFHRKKDPDE